MTSQLVAVIFIFLFLVAAAVAMYYRKEWRRTKTLFQVGLRLNSTIQRKALLEIIMETAEKQLSAEASSIILVDEEKQELYFEVATGDKKDQVKEIRLQYGEGVAGWVAKTGRSVLVADTGKDPRWSNRVSNKVNVPTRNMICVPVISNGKTLGVLQVINKRGNRSFNRRDLQLLEMIASPAAIALENMFLYEALKQSMETLRETTAAKERMESELKIAREIQLSFLPGQSIKHGFAELHALLIPAREVGGDFYHYIDLGNNKLLLCLGDVSDKGMPAALFMSGLMIWIQSKASAERTPSQILREINREVATDDSTMFATIFMAVLDTLSGRLQYCDGGHCTPFIVSSDGVKALDTAKNLPIGIFREGLYEDREIRLNPGETLVLYTDGVTEAENSNGEWFTSQRLQQNLNQSLNENDPSCQLTERLRNQVFEFAQDQPQSDDIAIMSVSFNK